MSFLREIEMLRVPATPPYHTDERRLYTVEAGLKLIGSIVRQCPCLRDARETRRVVSSILFLGTALLLVLMPLTEHLTTWDRFFPGGHDAEFGLLGIAAFFSLAAVLSSDYERSVAMVLSAQCLIRLFSRRVRIPVAQRWLSGDIAISPLVETSGRSLEICSCPLRI